MKNFIYLLTTGIAMGTLSSCASLSPAMDDDLYVTKGVEIPVDESLNDETSYTAYKYNKERDNSSTQYVTNNYYGNNYGNNSYGYSPYGYSPYYGYQPYYGYNSYHRHWRYIPGYGWSYIGRTPHFGFSYNSGFGFGMGYGYGYGYGYNPYGYGYNPYGYGGYGYGGYGYGYGYSPYGYGYSPYGYGYYNPYYYGNNNGHNIGNSNSGGGNWGNATNTSSNHYRGPRGSSGGGVVTRNNAPGVLKTGKYVGGNIQVPNTNTDVKNINTKGINRPQNMIVKPVAKENIVIRNTDPTIKETKTVQPKTLNPNVNTTVNPVNEPVRGNVRINEERVITPTKVTPPTRVSPSENNKVVTPVQRPIRQSNSNPTIQRNNSNSPVRNSGTIRQNTPSRNNIQSQPSQRVSPPSNQQSRPSSQSASPSNRGSGTNSSGSSRPSGSGSNSNRSIGR